LRACATPTSISTWLGGVKRQICQRSTGTSSARWLPRSAVRQKGGGITFVRPLELRQLRRIRKRRVARPHPDEAVAFDGRKRSNRGKAAQALTRHGDRLAVAAHFEPVVAADELALGDRAERERRAAMGAKILERRSLAFRAAIEDDRFAADLSAQRIVIDLIRRAGNSGGQAESESTRVELRAGKTAQVF
jgi:hypothetical protein